MPNRGRVAGLTTAILVTATALSSASPASGEDAPGPAFVDQLGSAIQPLRSTERGEVADARDAGLTIEGGSVLVDVYVKRYPGETAARLRDLGMEVAATGTEPLSVVEGLLPLTSISEAAELAGTGAVLPVMGGGTDAGAVTSQGVAAHGLPAAIAAAGTSGAGVDVGVISDSIDQVGGGVNASQATGDLPPDPRVVVLSDDTTSPDDEGRAMAEIVYDEAPGLNRILFSSGTAAGPVGKAVSIDALVAGGADVITDDIFYLSEPFFQDGIVSRAADRASAAGVPYFASAGNRARQSYEQGYRDSTITPGLHDFDPGAGNDTRSCFNANVPTSRFIQIALHWDEPLGSATTDLDIRITNPAGATLGTAGLTDNIATGLPSEFATFVNAGAPVQPCVEISRFAGARAPFMKWIEQDDYAPGVPQFGTQSDTINPDAASAGGALAVAAVAADDPGLNTPESFSSRGPKTRLFDPAGNRLATPLVLRKPELAAADEVSTTVPGFTPFLGTSAASPSAAGIAAILRSANPNASVDEIYAQMTDPANAIECTASALVPDPDCGAGFILADRAVTGLDRTPAAPVATLRPRTPNGKGGYYTSRVTVSWIPDPESPTEASSGCETVTISTDGRRTLTCTATSGGGTGSGSVTVKRDTKKPSKPKFKGIRKGRAYSPGQLPSKGKVKRCRSKDRTSGIRSCKVRGFSTKPGKHVLQATATDRAGLRSNASLTYSVR